MVSGPRFLRPLGRDRMSSDMRVGTGGEGGGQRRAGVEREGGGGARILFEEEFLGGWGGGRVEMRSCDVGLCEGDW